MKFYLLLTFLFFMVKNISGTAEVNCEDGTYITRPDPDSCNHYYLCDHNKFVHFQCPHGLHFSQSLGSCLWPKFANCDINNQPHTSDEVPTSQTPHNTSTEKVIDNSSVYPEENTEPPVEGPTSQNPQNNNTKNEYNSSSVYPEEKTEKSVEGPTSQNPQKTSTEKENDGSSVYPDNNTETSEDRPTSQNPQKTSTEKENDGSSVYPDENPVTSDKGPTSQNPKDDDAENQNGTSSVYPDTNTETSEEGPTSQNPDDANDKKQNGDSSINPDVNPNISGSGCSCYCNGTENNDYLENNFETSKSLMQDILNLENLLNNEATYFLVQSDK